MREHGILYNLDQARADYMKRVVSICVVDKRTRRVIRPTKIVVLKELTSLGIRVQQIIAGNTYAIWRVLLPSQEDAVALTKTPLENKDHIFKVEYMGRRRTMVTLHEVPEYYGVKNLTAHMLDYGDVVAVHPDVISGGMEVRANARFQDLPLHSQLVGRERGADSHDNIRTEARMLALFTGWSPVSSMPGEEGLQETPRYYSRFPATQQGDRKKGGSRSLACSWDSTPIRSRGTGGGSPSL